MRIDLVGEAEKIVMDCPEPQKPAESRKQKKNAEFDVLLNTVMALSCVMLAVVLGLGFS
jgi:uncharacterized protein HemX